MNEYYQNWLIINSKIDQIQLNLFIAVLTGYMVYQWHFRRHFVWAASVYLSFVAVSIVVGLWL